MKQALVLVLLGLFAACSPGEHGATPPAAAPTPGAPVRRPSILFVSVDTLAAGHTSLHGYARKTTPALEELAREAVTFERCLANAPFTTPSYVSQFTGLLPECSWSDPDEFRKRTGLVAEAEDKWNLPSARTTLAERLRAGGYRTAAFVDNPMCGKVFGLDQGFDVYDMSAAELPAHEPAGGIRAEIPLLLRWLDERGDDAPFFAFVNLLDVHEPYLPPPEVRGRFDDDALWRAGREVPVGRDGRFGTVPGKVARLLRGNDDLSGSVPVAPLVARYDEEIVAADAALGELYAALRARGLWDELLVVFSADHGEAMDGPEYKFGHGTHVESVLHVPLVIKLPGARGAGRRVASAVQLLDLYPTLLDLAGLEPAPDVQGRSLRALLEGGELAPATVVHHAGRLRSRAVSEGRWRLLVTHPGNDANGILSSKRGRAWIEQHHPDLAPLLFSSRSLTEMVKEAPAVRAVMVEAHTALAGPFYELYDLELDPDQQHDVAAEHPEIVARLVRVHEDARDAAAAERQRVPVGQASGAAAPLEELRSLGYAGEEE